MTTMGTQHYMLQIDAERKRRIRRHDQPKIGIYPEPRLLCTTACHYLCKKLVVDETKSTNLPLAFNTVCTLGD